MTKTHKKSTILKSGRPPLSGSSTLRASLKSTTKQSSRATRTLIRAHHNLHKSRAKALTRGDDTLVAAIDSQIEQLGGLEAYQVASLTGQSKDRGGDSSLLLVSWLEELVTLREQHFRVLEIGALSSKNAISTKVGEGIECVRRIDLNSQEPESIEEIDFMALPVPVHEDDKFDIISLSLVLNYVPDASGRGEMLKRTRMFLRDGQSTSRITPCLFFVLPLPCISNSRYMTVDRLCDIMTSLGYHSLRRHQSTKLHYELFHHQKSSKAIPSFKKVEINPGKHRNNFSIIIVND